MDDILENLKKKGIVEFQTQFNALFKEINKTSAITQRYLKLSRPAAIEETKQWNFSATLGLLRDALQTAANRIGFEILLDDTLRKIPLYSYSGDLEQIFFTLMQNAIQAAEEKKGSALRIWASRKKEFWVLQFEDNCGGIPKKQLEKIFEPFYSTKSREQGTGLGLTIVRQILEEHGGKIQVQSQLRKGTVFSLWLPCPLANSSRKKKRQQK
jgi:two-component system, sporulation sensor kinase E